MIEDIKKDSATRMAKAIATLKQEFAKLRTGRAHASLLDHLTVSYYGNDTPLAQVASVTASDARTLTITPWEKSMVSAIEKALHTSGLGLTPNTAGTVIRVPMPPLTEERRKEMVRVVRHEAEGGRVAIRNVRRDAMTQFKDALKDKRISEDEERRAQEVMQKLTDQHVAEVDRLLQAKEAELLEV